MTRQPTPANILDKVLTADVLPDRTVLRGRLRWDYSQVAPVDRKAVEDAAVDILANGQRMQSSVIEIGSRLIEVKRLLDHGQFGEWCDTEFGMSERTAQSWMNIARTFAGKSAEISLLSDSSLALLAAPSTPEPARQEAIAEAQATGRSPSVQRTKEIIAQHKPGPVPAPIPTPTAKEYGAAVQDRSAISNQQSPISNPAAVTVDAEPAPRIRGYNVLDDYALRDMPAPANAYEAMAVPDGRISAARHLMALYGAVIDSEEQYGELTGRFSDTLTVKRELTHMITHLSDLITIIEHPEEVTAAD